MKIQTAISDIRNGDEIIRGHKLAELMANNSFTEVIFLLFKGRLPRENERKMMDAVLVSAIDHGPGTASALAARISASAGNNTQGAVAAGILAMGGRHGMATRDAAKFFQENIENEQLESLVKKMKEKGKKIPGYGHPVLDIDARSQLLLAAARQNDIHGKYCRLSQQVSELLNLLSSKPLPMNIDGAIAIVLSDMEFAWQTIGGVFLIARLPGLLAQVCEEEASNQGLRRLPQEQIEYIGE